MPDREYDNPMPGLCIFCRGSFDEAELTREHIIPLFLSGRGEMVIKKASCRRCQGRANDTYEQKAANGELLVPRLLLDLKRRKRKAPKSLPPVCISPSGIEDYGLPFDTYLSAEEHPQTFTITMTEPAGMLEGIDRQASTIRLRIIDLGRNGKERAGMIGTESTVRMGDVQSIVAKAAYCSALVQSDLRAWDMDQLRSLLVGERDDVLNFVGNPRQEPRLARRHLHAIYFREVGPYLTGLVHLFASCGGPVFQVVVGQRR